MRNVKKILVKKKRNKNRWALTNAVKDNLAKVGIQKIWKIRETNRKIKIKRSEADRKNEEDAFLNKARNYRMPTNYKKHDMSLERLELSFLEKITNI